MIFFTILVFIVILGILIFVHEVGHFVMAKRAGMKVEEFGFGFPPRAFGVKKGETIYSINWIPLGGFVKIKGEDGGADAADDPGSFSNGTYANRFAVLLAGVAMNFLLGWFLIFLGFSVIGTPMEIAEGADLAGARVADPEITIIAVETDSPASYAGFKPGDVILSLDGREFSNIPEMIEYSNFQAGVQVTYRLLRGEEAISRDVIPRIEVPEDSGAVGFAPAMIANVTYPVGKAFTLSLSSFLGRVTGILAAFGLLLSTIFSSGKLIEGLSGPVGIAVLTQDFLRLGSVYLTQFTAILSINLAVINAFPFPALDGGRVLFLIVERLRGVKSMKFEQIANMVGFVLLIFLMVVVTFRDIDRFSAEFSRLFERIF